MFESGIGRAHNVAMSALAGFVLPGDVSASRRYWERDVIQPEITVTPGGTIIVPKEPGIGHTVDMDYLRSVTVSEQSWNV